MRRLALAIVAIVVCGGLFDLLLAGCESSSAFSSLGTCSSQADCPIYRTCALGWCRERCDYGQRCEGAERCVDAACLPETLTSSSASSGYNASSSSTSSSGAPPNYNCPVASLPVNALDDYYKPGTPPSPGACSSADLALLQRDGGPSASAQDILLALVAVSDSCRSCALTSDGDGATAWAPIVTRMRGGILGQEVIPNWGACISGKSSQVCGEYAQKLLLCYVASCRGCSVANASTCRNQSVSSPTCQGFVQPLVSRCGSMEYAPASAQCGADLVSHIRGHCE